LGSSVMSHDIVDSRPAPPDAARLRVAGQAEG
jgi:hypothetical protein